MGGETGFAAARRARLAVEVVGVLLLLLGMAYGGGGPLTYPAYLQPQPLPSHGTYPPGTGYPTSLWPPSVAEAFHAANDWSDGIQLTPDDPYAERMDVWIDPPTVGNLRLPKLDRDYRLFLFRSTSSQSLHAYGSGNNVSLQLNNYTYTTDSLTVTDANLTIGQGILDAKTVDVNGILYIPGSGTHLRVSNVLHLGPPGVLETGGSTTIEMNGASWKNESSLSRASSGTADVELLFQGTGGVPATLEAASSERKGFFGNFAFNRLTLGGTTPAQVRLVDEFNNGNRAGGKECVFTWNLAINPGSSLDLNGLGVFVPGNCETQVKNAIASGLIVDGALNWPNRLDAVYSSKYDYTPFGQRVIKSWSGVPEYQWRRGCSPTSATMIMAYWDQTRPQMWPGTPPATSHAGDNSVVNTIIEHIGDLMHTSTAGNGATLRGNIAPGMVAYATEQGYRAASGILWVQDKNGFTFDVLKREIDAGRPVLVSTEVAAGGHSIVAYGYQDFQGTFDDYIAVRDTWVDGNSNGKSGVVAKVEDGIEWWKWTTDTSQTYRIEAGTWFYVGTSTHEHPVLIASSFESDTAFQESFSVNAGPDGSAGLTNLSDDDASVLLIHSAGTDPSSVSSPTSTVDRLGISFLYAFETPGTLKVLMDNVLLAQLTDPAGMGTVDNITQFAMFSQEFNLASYGLDPQLSHTLSLELLAGSEHSVYLDDLLVSDPAAAAIPEPGTVCLLFLSSAALLLRRRRRR